MRSHFRNNDTQEKLNICNDFNNVKCCSKDVRGTAKWQTNK